MVKNCNKIEPYYGDIENYNRKHDITTLHNNIPISTKN